MAVMTSRFAGTCKACNADFPAGTRIIWRRGAGARHLNVAECLAAAAAKVVAPPPPSLDLSGLVAFLVAAKDRGLKFPKARFLAPDGKGELLLSLSGSQTSQSTNLGSATSWFYIGTVTPAGAVFGRRA